MVTKTHTLYRHGFRVGDVLFSGGSPKDLVTSVGLYSYYAAARSAGTSVPATPFLERCSNADRKT
jgi:hypothetical protein